MKNARRRKPRRSPAPSHPTASRALSSGKQDHLRSTTIVAFAIVLVGLGVAGWLLSIREPQAATAQSVPGQAFAEGVVVDLNALPRTASGEPDLTALPSVRAIEEAPAELKAGLEAMAAKREAIDEATPVEATWGRLLAPPVSHPSSPARMDSGDPNPDRLNAAAALLLSQ